MLQRVKERGGDVRTSRPVKIVRRSAGGFDVEFAGGTETFDLVLSTVAIPELLRIAPDLPEETRGRGARSATATRSARSSSSTGRSRPTTG